MSKHARFLWGWSKVDKVTVMDYIDFTPQASAPPGAPGRLYMDDNYMFHKCIDGTSFATILDVIGSANPPAIAQGRIWIDGDYKIRISENGSSWVTVTTS